MNRICLGLFSLGLFAMAGCPVTADELCAKNACQPADDATTPIDGGDGGPPIADKDPCADTPDAQECFDRGIFVNAAAAEGGDGSLSKPFKQIQAAVNAVDGTKKNVIYVCPGSYTEQVSITVPLTIIGSFECEFASRTPAAEKPKLTPQAGDALKIAKTSGVSIIDLAVEGVSTATIFSAIAIVVSRSQNILLRRVDAKAHDAQPGAPGANGEDNFTGDFPTRGGDAAGNIAGSGPTCNCLDEKTWSKGGRGADSTGVATKGEASTPVGGDNQNQCAIGKGDGADGEAPSAAAAAAGAKRPGVVKADSWEPNDESVRAQLGVDGNPGQGGGGGGTNGPQAGGGGGCGGCGGRGGGAGGNGGSSFALLVFHSTKVTIENGSYAAGLGGAGGSGGNARTGQAGAIGGQAICPGGKGGAGAGGGGGGGGAGGFSAAIAYLGGEAPEGKDTATLSFAPKVKGGLGGSGAAGGGVTGKSGAPGLAGNDGEAGDLVPLPE